jgi:hypothetical protein
LALTVDPSSLHRRKVWECWETTEGRCGRWSALAALGARLRAADLDGFEAYRRPKPMEVKQIRVGPGIWQVLQVDPEDAEAEAAVASG